jgi:hypothetical protein
MGQELKCRVEFGGKSAEGKALLETKEIVFRGDFRLTIPIHEIKKLRAQEGKLHVAFPAGEAVFHLGPAAEKWREKILHPPSRLEKLGVKHGTKVSLAGAHDPAFVAELEKAGAVFDKHGAEIVFFAAGAKAALDKMPRIASGALWVIYPKKTASIPEGDVLAAGRALGLKDVKVASFSETHTALKFTSPKQ